MTDICDMALCNHHKVDSTLNCRTGNHTLVLAKEKPDLQNSLLRQVFHVIRTTPALAQDGRVHASKGHAAGFTPRLGHSGLATDGD